MVRRHLVITGRVQGVFYRGWMVGQARALGIDGWVRNCADGSVEAVVAGAPEAVEAIIARCRQGPSAARVEHIAIDDAAPGTLEGFEQRATV
jgi:acylphosphatase